MKATLNIVGLCLLLSLFISCAQQVTPTGGPSDYKAPELIKADPPQQSVNFQSDKIELQFNEFITLKDYAGGFIVSPPIPSLTAPEISGKKLTWKLKETLLPNTTYSFYLGNSVADITEGNLSDNLVYVISTGPTVDSIKAGGAVVNAFTKKPEDKIKLFLYPFPGSDSVLTKEPPRYITKSNKQGVYEFRNLAPGEYQLFALKDQNNNNLYDQPTESVAFLDKPVVISKDSAVLSGLLPELQLFETAPEKQFLKQKTIVAPGKISFVFNKVPAKPSIELVNQSFKKAWDLIEYSTFSDSIVFWYDESFGDSLKMIVRDGAFADTLKFKLQNKKSIAENQDKGRGQTAQPLSVIKTNLQGDKGLFPGDSLIVEFNSPIASVKSNSLWMKSGKDSTLVELLPFGNKDRRHFKLVYTIEKNTEYRFVLPKGCITNYLGESNDSITLSVKQMETKNLGELTIKPSITLSSAKQYLLYLQSMDDKTVRSINIDNPEKEIHFSYLNQGEYRIKVIADNNRNNRWDSGNFKERKAAEAVFFHPDVIQIKAKFDTEINLKLD